MSPEELERAVVELQDRQAIEEVLMTYSRGIDRLDRELLLSVHHDDATAFAMSGGRYLDRLEKRDGRWAIAARVCVRDWSPLTETPAVVKGLDERVRQLLRTGAQPARDRSDASYDRPLTIDVARAAQFREVAQARLSRPHA